MNVALFFTYDMSLKKWDETGLIEREILYYNQLVDKYPINFTFVTFGDEEDFKYQDKLKNIKIIPIYHLEKRFENKVARFLFSLFLPFKIRKYLNNIDIYKTNQLLGSWIPIVLKLITRKKLIVRTGYDILTFSIKERRGAFKTFMYYLLTQISLTLSDKYIVTSERDKSFLSNYFLFKKQKIVKINNWVVSTSYKNSDNRRGNRVLAVGRLESQKNYAALIKNLNNSNLELDIVGEGSLKSSLLNLSDELNVKVNFLGTLDHQKLLDLYYQYTYYVIFSNFEGHPKSLIESMSSGCIPIALDSDYLHEIIINNFNGVVLQTINENIAEKVLSIENQTDLKANLSKNAYEFVKDNYSINKIMKKEHSLYIDLIG
mgnify:FL=1